MYFPQKVQGASLFRKIKIRNIGYLLIPFLVFDSCFHNIILIGLKQQFDKVLIVMSY
jgi:hypothetical protein